MAVLRGKKGGVSSKNKDWRSYYGAAAYDSYVSAAKEKRRKWEEEQRAKQLEEIWFNREVLRLKMRSRGYPLT